MSKISVVMATYNGEKYIIEQLNSLLKQTVKIDEVIITDDCSKDHTVHLITDFINNNLLTGWRVIENKKNLGWRENFKRGFDLASGDYIFPCDQDDIWHYDKVEKMITCMDSHPQIELLAANYSTFFSENDTGSGSRRYAARSRKMNNNGNLKILGIDPLWPYVNRPGCVFCFTRKFYDSIVDQWNTKYAHDAILWRFARMDHALAILNYSVIDFRRHGDNATSEENRTRESRIQTFNDYIYFHKVALKRVKSDEDRKTLEEGILFLETRKHFFESANFLIWIKLAVRYRRFYNSLRGCLGDLYFAYRKYFFNFRGL